MIRIILHPAFGETSPVRSAAIALAEAGSRPRRSPPLSLPMRPSNRPAALCFLTCRVNLGEYDD